MVMLRMMPADRIAALIEAVPPVAAATAARASAAGTAALAPSLRGQDGPQRPGRDASPRQPLPQPAAGLDQAVAQVGSVQFSRAAACS